MFRGLVPRPGVLIGGHFTNPAEPLFAMLPSINTTVVASTLCNPILNRSCSRKPKPSESKGHSGFVRRAPRSWARYHALASCLRASRPRLNSLRGPEGLKTRPSAAGIGRSASLPSP